MRLRPMTQAEYDAWLDEEIKGYAQDKVDAGTWLAEEALERSAESFRSLLPAGLASPDQYLFTMEDEAAGRSVGTIWLGKTAREGKSKAFIYDIVVDETERGKGYGKQAMLLIEDEARKLGLTEIGLHVFGHNAIARDLYLKVGYEITDYVMSKSLK
jgi:RimJ/RimL family protein N-acetyltransferase